MFRINFRRWNFPPYWVHVTSSTLQFTDLNKKMLNVSFPMKIYESRDVSENKSSIPWNHRQTTNLTRREVDWNTKPPKQQNLTKLEIVMGRIRDSFIRFDNIGSRLQYVNGQLEERNKEKAQDWRIRKRLSVWIRSSFHQSKKKLKNHRKKKQLQSSAKNG
jgi:hypothetical protein